MKIHTVNRTIRGFHDDTGLIKVVTGVRRCGKSNLMATIADELRARGIDEVQIVEGFEDGRERLPGGSAAFHLPHRFELLPVGGRTGHETDRPLSRVRNVPADVRRMARHEAFSRQARVGGPRRGIRPLSPGRGLPEDREYAPLEKIRDNYPKYVLPRNDPIQSRNGILHRNLPGFMRDGEWF